MKSKPKWVPLPAGRSQKYPVRSVRRSAVLWALLVTLSATASVRRPTIDVDPSIYQTEQEKFVPHSGPGMFETYLAQSVPYGPVAPLVARVAALYGRSIQGRGEAHITVITPPEFRTLKQRVSIEDLHRLAAPKIQAAGFAVECLGRGEALVDGRVEATYFLVVRSAALVALRQQIAELYRRRGGAVSDFDPEEFFPHITLGYTKRDLHLDDGVAKDIRACVAQTRPQASAALLPARIHAR